MEMNREDAKAQRPRNEPDPALNELSRIVVDAAYKVYAALGPGLLESVYEACLTHELRRRGLKVETQVHLPVMFEGCRIEAALRIDLLVEGQLIVEVKAVEKLIGLHEAQLLTYLKLAGIQLGLLINFNTERFRSGVKRMVYSPH